MGRHLHANFEMICLIKGFKDLNKDTAGHVSVLCLECNIIKLCYLQHVTFVYNVIPVRLEPLSFRACTINMKQPTT